MYPNPQALNPRPSTLNQEGGSLPAGSTATSTVVDEQDRSAPEEGPANKRMVRFVAHGMPHLLFGAAKEPARIHATEAPRVSPRPGAVH